MLHAGSNSQVSDEAHVLQQLSSTAGQSIEPHLARWVPSLLGAEGRPMQPGLLKSLHEQIDRSILLDGRPGVQCSQPTVAEQRCRRRKNSPLTPHSTSKVTWITFGMLWLQTSRSLLQPSLVSMLQHAVALLSQEDTTAARREACLRLVWLRSVLAGSGCSAPCCCRGDAQPGSPFWTRCLSRPRVPCCGHGQSRRSCCRALRCCERLSSAPRRLMKSGSPCLLLSLRCFSPQVGPCMVPTAAQEASVCPASSGVLFERDS